MLAFKLLIVPSPTFDSVPSNCCRTHIIVRNRSISRVAYGDSLVLSGGNSADAAGESDRAQFRASLSNGYHLIYNVLHDRQRMFGG